MTNETRSEITTPARGQEQNTHTHTPLGADTIEAIGPGLTLGLGHPGRLRGDVLRKGEKPELDRLGRRGTGGAELVGGTTSERAGLTAASRAVVPRVA